jgi:hypothetical protein
MANVWFCTQDLTALRYEWPAIVRDEEVALPVDAKPPIGYPLMPKRFPRLSDVYLVILYPPDVQNDLPVILQEMYEPTFEKVRHHSQHITSYIQPHISVSRKGCTSTSLSTCYYLPPHNACIMYLGAYCSLDLSGSVLKPQIQEYSMSIAFITYFE